MDWLFYDWTPEEYTTVPYDLRTRAMKDSISRYFLDLPRYILESNLGVADQLQKASGAAPQVAHESSSSDDSDSDDSD